MKIKVNGKIYNVIKEVYDPFYECYLYYTDEDDVPFCDLDDTIELIYDEEKKDA